MRKTGKVVRWLDDRGFGFIAPDQGGPEAFVHSKSLAPQGLLRRDTLAMMDSVATPTNTCVARPPRPLREALWTRPAGDSFRTHALVEGIRPALLASLAFVWTFTGLVSLWWNRPAGHALLAATGLLLALEPRRHARRA